MKNLTRTVLIGAASAVLTLICAGNSFADDASTPVAPSSRIELFNGKDFSGWTFCMQTNAEPANTWAVTNGLMLCTGQPYGYARTTTEYRDYKLTVEWRFVKPVPHADNSGVFVHLHTPDKVWPKCIECQGQYRHQGDIILLGGTTVNDMQPTNAVRSVRMRGPSNENPGGEWNTYEIIAAGDTLKVSVNGKVMNEVTNSSVRSGFIAIQSEGGDLELRKASLEPVSASR
jgi:hypothetical protein